MLGEVPSLAATCAATPGTRQSLAAPARTLEHVASFTVSKAARPAYLGLGPMVKAERSLPERHAQSVQDDEDRDGLEQGFALLHEDERAALGRLHRVTRDEERVVVLGDRDSRGRRRPALSAFVTVLHLDARPHLRDSGSTLAATREMRASRVSPRIPSSTNRTG